MPCDCSGYGVEVSAFGKLYTGYTVRGGGDTVDYRQIIKDGEHALCRAQQVIRELVGLLDTSNKKIGHPLFQRTQNELALLHAHEKTEADKQAKEKAEREADNARMKQQLLKDKAKLEDELKKLE